MREHDKIELTAADGHRFSAYRSAPRDGEPKGAVVVIQEIFGVNEHIRAVVDGFAADGYVAIAPQLFDRAERDLELDYSDESMARGGQLKTDLGFDGPVMDIDAAIGSVTVRDLKAVTVGYCWGGALAWLSATRLGESLYGAVSYYGAVGPFMKETPLCPTMLHFGEEDAWIPMEQVEAFRAAHPDSKVYTYKAGHGFNCDMRGSYDAHSARLARDRTMAFIEEVMK